MTAHRPKTLVRALVGLLSLGVVMTPLLVAESGTAKAKKVQDAKFRAVTAPNVFYPVVGTKSTKDLRTFTKKHQNTDILSSCGAGVRASTPGTAIVTPTRGKYVVRVLSGKDGLLTVYGFLDRVTVVQGQPIQSGQTLGVLGANPSSKRCTLYFAVAGRNKFVNPSVWLNSFVGKTPPVSGLYNMRGINLASFNILGASHTRTGSRFATYPSRMAATVNLFNSRALDVIGTQEFQETQFDYFNAKGYGKAFGAHYWDPEGKRRDTENAILWRKSTMEFVSGSTFDIPYFGGNIRHVPVVLLRQKSSGRTAYFLNVHNPANVRGPAAKWRAQAIEIERKKIVELRATGRPVFLTGDFNDRQAAFCPLTANKLTISPNSLPSTKCLYPKESSIDWIFAAGQTRFSYFLRDKSPQTSRISDHPIILTRAHLQN
jgi:endonuclease/exonuclease/phosphatase family metal-dependent hydrolase